MTEPAPEPTPTSGVVFTLNLDELAARVAAELILEKLHEVTDQITRRNGRIS